MTRSPFQARPSGDLGSPAEIGATKKQSRVSAPPTDEAEPDGDEMPSTAPSPEALHYVDHAEPCSDCQHMSESGQCAILQMPVTPDGHCVAFEGRDGGEMDEAEPMPQGPPSGRAPFGGSR